MNIGIEFYTQSEKKPGEQKRKNFYIAFNSTHERDRVYNAIEENVK